MASVPPGLVGVQVDDLVGAVLQKDLGRPDPQRLGRPNRNRVPGSPRPPSGLGQLRAQLAADLLAAIERGDHCSQHEHPRRAARGR